MLNSVILLRVYIGVFILLSGLKVCAQQWLPGFAYRKKITFNKSQIDGANPSGTPSLNLIKFPVLVVLQDPDLKYISGKFDQKISNANGLDVSFASFTTPEIPLKYEIESYHAEKGLLICWIQIPLLSTKMNPSSATSIYLYYGSSILHDPHGDSAKSIWEEDYHHVDHMNKNATGKIGEAWKLNGSDDKMLFKTGNSTEVTLSAWIRLSKSGKEQMIISTDTLQMGGYQFKVNSMGNLVLEAFASGHILWSVKGVTTLSTETWYYVDAGFKNGNVTFHVNGSTDASRNAALIAFTPGGCFSVGGSKQNDQYLDGIIDEVRLGNKGRPPSWLKTEYQNQNDPFGFYTIGNEEINAAVKPSFFVFVGTKNSLWNEPSNWNLGSIPPNYMNIKIAAGKTVDLNVHVIVNRFLMETGSSIQLNNELNISYDSELEQHATIYCNAGNSLKFNGDVINNGSLDLSGVKSKLVFAGNNTELNFSGNGIATVGSLELDMSGPSSTVNLNTILKVSNSVNLIKGILKSNGNLTLLSTKSKNASILPVLNIAETNITGDVQVQNFIDGSFPAPSTGRGWRLLCSPVVNSLTSSLRYHLLPVKHSVFVTGQGGILNGFDPSPNNGATIYIHDQSLPGSLTQKYLAIKNMQTTLALGQGFFLFSRGSRLAQNAYENQIQPPFSNPEPYLITYTGKLFIGSLKLELLNRNLGNEGDGFNLLGNPYAASIRWGSLIKENLEPYIWVFDPLNNSYRVSDDPNEIIPAGAGFFVRVNSGFKYGYLSFFENCKIML